MHAHSPDRRPEPPHRSPPDALAATVGQVLDTLGRTAPLAAMPLALADRAGQLLHLTPALRALLAADSERRRVEHALGACARRACPDAAGVAEQIRTPAACYRVDAAALGTDGVLVLLTVRPLDPAECADPGEVRVRFGLTRREAEVAVLLARRRSNPEVAEALGISLATARHHVEAVLRKLGVGSRNGVAAALGFGKG